MLNYPNLNPEDFESLCRDIMERKLGVPLRRFGPGRDGGIDLTDDVETHSIVVQVKHYQSDSAVLVRNLKKELPKVQKLHPRQYYICCSRQLSAENIRDLYETFRPWMASDQNIVTQTEIEDFLNEANNNDILRKNYKLWFSDPRVLDMLETQDIFLDCQWILDEIQEDLPIFVKTQAYSQALELLKTSRLLCITGDPGTGKSMTSRMLAAAYIAQGYRLRFTSNVTDLAPLKRSVSADPEVKEIILLDDCFGQAYFEMQSSQNMELLTLIHHVKQNPSKVLILNSRITILNEAREKQPQLVRCLEREELELYRLDMTQSSEEDRARILYSHLHRRNLPQAYIDEITKDQRYWDIIRHKNYNPRILEFVCTPTHYRDIPPEGYYDFIQQCLNNPTEIWKDEYENRLSLTDQILLQTLYSLGKYGAPKDLVRHCFNHRIKDNIGIQKTVDPFPSALARLSGSLVSIYFSDAQECLTMVNPSVNDFLRARLANSDIERQEIEKYVCCPEQIEHMIPENEQPSYIQRLFNTGAIENLYFISEELKTSWITEQIIDYELLCPAFKSTILKGLSEGPNTWGDILLYNLSGVTPLTLKFWDYYQLSAFYSEENRLYNLLHILTLNHSYPLDAGGILTPIPFFSPVLCDSIRILDTLYTGSLQDAYHSQVTHWLEDMKTQYLSLDFFEIDPPLFDIAYQSSQTRCSYTVSEIESLICNTLQSDVTYARTHLPPYFQNLPLLKEPWEIHIIGLKDYIQRYHDSVKTIEDCDDYPQASDSPIDINELFQTNPH